MRAKIFYDFYQIPQSSGPILCLSLLSMLIDLESLGNKPASSTICQSLSALALQGANWWPNPARTYISSPNVEQTKNISVECILSLLTSLADRQVTKNVVTSNTSRSKLRQNLEAEYEHVENYLLHIRQTYPNLRPKVIICWKNWRSYHNDTNSANNVTLNPILDDCLTLITQDSEQEILDASVDSIIKTLRDNYKCKIKSQRSSKYDNGDLDYSSDEDVVDSNITEVKIKEAQDLHSKILNMLPVIQSVMDNNLKNGDIELMDSRAHLILFLLHLDPRPINLVSSSIALMRGPISDNLWDIANFKDFYGYIPSSVGISTVGPILRLIDNDGFPKELVPDLCKIIARCKSAVFEEAIDDFEFAEYQDSLGDIINMCCSVFSSDYTASCLAQSFSEYPIGTMLSMAIVVNATSPKPCQHALGLINNLPQFPSSPPTNYKEGLARSAALILLSSCICSESSPDTYQMCKKAVLDEFKIAFAGLKDERSNPICQKVVTHAIGILNGLAWKYRPRFFVQNEAEILNDSITMLSRAIPYLDESNECILLESMALFIKHGCMLNDCTYSLVPVDTFHNTLNIVLYPSCISRMTLKNFSKSFFQRGSDNGCAFFRLLQSISIKPEYNKSLVDYIATMIIPLVFDAWKHIHGDISTCESAGRLLKHAIRACGKYFAPFLGEFCQALMMILIDPNFALQSTHLYTLDWLERLSHKYVEWDSSLVKTLIENIANKAIYLLIAADEKSEYTTYLSEDLFGLLTTFFYHEPHDGSIEAKTIEIACNRLAHCSPYQESRCLAKFLQTHVKTPVHQNAAIDAAFAAMARGSCYGATSSIAELIYYMIKQNDNCKNIINESMNQLPQAVVQDPTQRQELLDGFFGNLDKVSRTVVLVDNL